MMLLCPCCKHPTQAVIVPGVTSDTWTSTITCKVCHAIYAVEIRQLRPSELDARDLALRINRRSDEEVIMPGVKEAAS